MSHTNDENVKQTATNQAKEPRSEQHFSGPTPIEPQRSATAESNPAITEATENLDIDFDDPQLEVGIEREIQRSRAVLEEKFEALDQHLGQATKVAVVIRALVEDERD